jgi:hypothetical protein
MKGNGYFHKHAFFLDYGDVCDYVCVDVRLAERFGLRCICCCDVEGRGVEDGVGK